MMANNTILGEKDRSHEMDLPSPDSTDDPELLLNVWLDELDTLTAVSFISRSILQHE